MLRLCLTGGPGSGKTVIFNHLSQMLEERGYFVFLSPETVPELVLNGIKPNKYLSEVAFYNLVLRKQIDKESLYNKLEQYYPTNKIVIVYDRGIMDIGTALDKAVFDGMLKKRGMSVNDAYAHYDAVLHLVTAADGAERFYQWNDPTSHQKMSNLAAESPEEAIEKDKQTLHAWKGHDRLHIIKSYTNFSDKIKSVTDIVFRLLGETPPTHNVKKYIIKRPTDYDLENLQFVSKTNITQIYLHQHSNTVDRRILQRGTKETGFTYYYVEKVDMGVGEEKFVTEKIISPSEYKNYILEADHDIKPISKTRNCFIYNNKYYEIDLYSFDDTYAILEVEDDNDETISLPFTIINEVTDNPSFKSRNLAKKRSLSSGGTELQRTDVWTYETGREEKGIVFDDSRFYSVEMTKDENKAIKLSLERGRTYLIRYKNVDGKQLHQWYDHNSKTWIDD